MIGGANKVGCDSRSTSIGSAVRALASKQVAGASPFPLASNPGHGSSLLDRTAVPKNNAPLHVLSFCNRGHHFNEWPRVESKPNLLKRAAPLSEDPISKVRVLDIPEHSRGVVCQSLTLAIPEETRGAILQDSTHAEPEATRGADCQNPTLEYRHRARMQFPEVGQPWDVVLDPNLDVIPK